MNQEDRKKKQLKRRRLSAALSSSTGPSQLNLLRLSIGFVLIILFFVILLFRVAYWQIVRADDLQVKAMQSQNEDVEIAPVRGTIYDSNMNPLAQTVTEYELYVYTESLYKDESYTDEQRATVVADMAEITGQKEETVQKKLESEESYILLASGLKQSAVQQAEKKYSDSIVIKTTVSRSYPNGDFASHVIGFVDSDNSGRNGLEYQYNSILTGIKGRVVRTTDNEGNTLSNGNLKYYPAEDGQSIVTTIDEVIQNYAEEAVAAGMKRSKAESITCVVMDPKTGNILAMVSTPSYDPNDPYEPSNEVALKAFEQMSQAKQSDYLSQMWTNPAISSVYEPGSTFKLITAASALDSGSATSKSKYKDPGYININGTTIKCWGSAHGTQTLKQAVGNSCNPALARVALDMGADTFYSYIDLMGFNDLTGIDLPGEGMSIVKDPTDLGPVDLGTTGFGQGIAVTPIQMLSAINALGNDGVLMKPKVVKKILDSEGNTVEEIEDTEVRKVVSSDVSDTMREIMQYYVEKGGGDAAYIPGYRIGGKTGTANIASGGGYSSQTVASFIAMAPMDDPQVSVLVMVSRPKGSEFGATNAGPIVKEIMGNVLPYLGVEKKYSKNEEKEESTAKVKVPNVTDMNSGSAIYQIQAAGLKYKVMPEGSGTSFLVVDQYPKAGTKVEKGSTVYIYSE